MILITTALKKHYKATAQKKRRGYYVLTQIPCVRYYVELYICALLTQKQRQNVKGAKNDENVHKLKKIIGVNFFKSKIKHKSSFLNEISSQAT